MAEPDKTGANDIRIVKFFDHLHEPLWGMPWSESSRINRELSLHIEEIVDARQAAGNDEDEAVSYALRQLGSPSDLGKKLRKEWRLSGACHAGVSVWAVAESYLWLLPILTLTCLCTAKFFSVHHNDINNGNVALLLAAPIFTGVALGARRAREAVASVVHMTAIAYVMFNATYLAGSVWRLHAPGAHVPITGEWYFIAIGTIPNFALIALCGAVPAYLISSWKRRGFYRVSPDDLRLRGRMASH